MANLVDFIAASGTSVSGYIESDVAKRCGTCEYYVKDGMCNNKVVLRDPKVPKAATSEYKKVNARTGCCDEWEAS